MIEVKNLHKSFEKQKILNNISTHFEKGKTSLIIGKSGSGKTVMLKSLVGLHSIDRGEVIFDHRIYSRLNTNEKQQFRLEMGMVFQGCALFDFCNIEENVTFPLKMFTNMSDSDMKDRANVVLKRVNLYNVNHKYPSELSGGMQKRVAIARSIVTNPNYLFCDEPNSGLDPETAVVIDNLIKEITQEYNITTIINTHDMNSVMEIGDKIVFLEDGKKAWEGTKEEILYTDNESIVKFVYSSELFKKIKKNL